MVQAEVLLVAVFAGIYVYDSAALLYSNEGILMPRGARGWRVSLGSAHYRLLGKNVYIGNPLLPHRPEFRLFWHLDGDPARPAVDWQARRRLFAAAAPMSLGMTFAVFVLLPIGLFSRLREGALLACLLLLYVCMAALLGWMWRQRSALGVSRTRFLSLAFEALVCPPLALNLVRKVSRAMSLGEDLAHAGRRLQRPEDWQALRRRLVDVLEEAIDAEDEGSARAAALKRRLEDLLVEGAACP